VKGDERIRELRIIELGKYERAYTAENYRHGTNRMKDSQAAVAHWPPGILLDVGCGRGEWLDYMEGRGFVGYGTEIVPALVENLKQNVQFAWAHDLPFDDDTFDWATSWDVLEHILPGDDELLLGELHRVAVRGFAVSANNRTSKNHLGEQLHINRRPYEEWDELVRMFGGKVTYHPAHQQPHSPIWVVEL
jgi:ubiquinone/menaquinone biosynthesis C-methylase UbiE